MAVGLHELTGVNNKDLTSQDILNAIKPGITEEGRTRLQDWAEEFKFWEDCAKIYCHIKDTRFYNELVETIRNFIEPKEGEVWLDAGCGPAKMSQIIWEKSRGEVKRIHGIDIVLEPARKTLVKLDTLPLELKYANLGETLPFPDSFFDGIVGNLVFTYVIDFEGKKGKEAFVEVTKEMFRVLKPGGHLVWSTVKRNVFPWRTFLVALPNTLSIRKQIQHRAFGLCAGIRILRYGFGIISKGRKGIYTFLNPEEYEKILEEIGFRSFQWRKTFAGQAWVNRAVKP